MICPRCNGPMIGPTGDPPITRDPSDRGGLNAALSVQDGLIVLEFGTPVNWTCMTPAHARELAAALVRLANAAEGVTP